jgi:hypothetical protein
MNSRVLIICLHGIFYDEADGDTLPDVEHILTLAPVRNGSCHPDPPQAEKGLTS